jgi:hypothetical protein
MTRAAGNARSDDCGSLRDDGLAYVALEMAEKTLQPPIAVKNMKAGTRGFKHPMLGRLLCPIKHLAEFDLDQATCVINYNLGIYSSKRHSDFCKNLMMGGYQSPQKIYRCFFMVMITMTPMRWTGVCAVAPCSFACVYFLIVLALARLVFIGLEAYLHIPIVSYERYSRSGTHQIRSGKDQWPQKCYATNYCLCCIAHKSHCPML